jgi:sugar phosphate isomerase/epimerase
VRTIEQIAKEVGREHFAGYPSDKRPDDVAWKHLDQSFYEVAKEAARVARMELIAAVKGSEPIPGVRPFRLATADELIDAWDAFDGDNVSVFIDAWNAYTAGEDFACPESPDGLHDVSDGSCNGCGDKNRG